MSGKMFKIGTASFTICLTYDLWTCVFESGRNFVFVLGCMNVSFSRLLRLSSRCQVSKRLAVCTVRPIFSKPLRFSPVYKQQKLVLMYITYICIRPSLPWSQHSDCTPHFCDPKWAQSVRKLPVRWVPGLDHVSPVRSTCGRFFSF